MGGGRHIRGVVMSAPSNRLSSVVVCVGADITTPRMWRPPPITKPETVVVGRVGWGFVLGPDPITKQKEAPPRRSGSGASLDFN